MIFSGSIEHLAHDNDCCISWDVGCTNLNMMLATIDYLNGNIQSIQNIQKS